MIKGLQAGFGDPIGAPLLTELRARGVQMVRLDMQPVTSPAAFAALIDEALVAGLRPLLIIRPDQAAWMPVGPALDVEVLNEPDLAGWGAADYAATITDVWRVLGGRHRLWTGGVSNCTSKTLVWLLQVLQRLPVDIGASVHRYPKNGATPSAPQEGFKTRTAEMDYLLRVVGGRPWGVSEVGYHTAEQRTGWWFWTRRWHWTDTQVAAFVASELTWWKHAGAAFCVVYQINDDLGDTNPADRFGIRRRDGSWKPVADVFREECVR